MWESKAEHDYNFTTNYKSIIGMAIAEIIDEPREKAHGLTLLINRETTDTFSDDENTMNMI